MPWQSIDTAPDDTVVLIHDDGYVGKAMKVVGDRWLDVECGRDDAFIDPPPQHWMPLPDPPSAQAPGAVSLSTAVDPRADVPGTRR